MAPCAPNIRCESRARRCGGATVRAARIYCSLRFIRPPRRLTSCDNGRVGCRALGLGHRKPARLAFERAHVFGEGAPDDLQGHRSAANRAADFITGCEILAHCLLMHAMADSGLDVNQPTVDCWRKASAALFTQSPTPGSLCLNATTWHRTLQRSQAEAARRAISTHMPELSLAHDPWPIAWLSGECNLEDSSVRLAPRLSAAMLFAAQVHLCCEGTLRVPPLLPLPLPGYLA